LVRRIWSRWPATTARSGRFRLYSGIMYWQVLGALATGQPPNAHYYLHSIQAIEHAWRDPDAEAGLIEELAQTVRGEHADDQHVA
jgi:hypothetical protein